MRDQVNKTVGCARATRGFTIEKKFSSVLRENERRDATEGSSCVERPDYCECNIRAQVICNITRARSDGRNIEYRGEESDLTGTRRRRTSTSCDSRARVIRLPANAFSVSQVRAKYVFVCASVRGPLTCATGIRGCRKTRD